MLESDSALSFKDAVFITENAYYDNGLSRSHFDQSIAELSELALFLSQNMNLLYDGHDKKEMQLQAAIFNTITGQHGITIDSAIEIRAQPFVYDFDDFFGEQDWSKMFVTKLLKTNSGNCHSMPFLYKILTEELGVKAYLAMAPNHTYIKSYSEKLGWYNTELTSATFPVDAWIMGSGYVHTDAVINRLYMDTLSLKQSIAACVIDLAKGYEHRFGKTDTDFPLRCAELCLQYYPTYVNAMLLKAETLKAHFESKMKELEAKYASELLEIPEYQKQFETMQTLYVQIHSLGYRQMPKQMYLNWLAELETQKEKYLNENFKELTK